MKDTLVVNLAEYDSSFSLSNKLGRLMWNMCYLFLFRPFNLAFFRKWRLFLLRAFGAKIGRETHVYASARIWAPWNLVMGEFSVMGPKVDCYNQGKIVIGDHTVISQKTYLCASSHDHTIFNFPLVLRPIEIGDQVWIAADAFIGPGVSIGDGAVVAARASVFQEVDSWTVVRGNPAGYVKDRHMKKTYSDFLQTVSPDLRQVSRCRL